ncbi:hypothetical protein [Streptomyces scopuliridis]|uniref:Uncharacterized protein n=1 Tax=Streptomyces scopuliridis RB72 TaxID=1440053 RepID=A0A2T7T9U0_9ACTN|nr:hypothetical protein [Streptomyces scopuliridis]PVE11862.1 hypothetical protein Y717_07425 [Streptomyces scopuliridis RB72]
MAADVSELVAVIRVLDRAAKLLGEESEHLSGLYGTPSAHGLEAGGPAQTLLGIAELHSAMKKSVEDLATAIGYATAGMDGVARRAVKSARMGPIGMPSGADRMARPLGDRTVQALETVRDIGGFFERDIATEIDICLAAPQATYPPKDWSTYRGRQHAR